MSMPFAKYDQTEHSQMRSVNWVFDVGICQNDHLIMTWISWDGCMCKIYIFYAVRIQAQYIVVVFSACSLRKHAYSNILKISPPKTENFQMKKTLMFFIFLLKNRDCGYLLEPPPREHGLWVLVRTASGGSNKYPQSMFLSKIAEKT